ncbi:MAG: AMP-binding protein [Flavobacteriales bacterium]
MSLQSIHIDFAKTSQSEITQLCKQWSESPEPWIKDLSSFILEWLSENDLIALQTSGTTGDPKTIRVEKQKLVNSALMTGAFFHLQENSKALLALSPQYIAGKMMIVRCAVLKWQLFAIEPSGNPLEHFDTPIDFTALVPNQLYNILHSPFAEKLNRIGKILIGGGPLSDESTKLIRNYKCRVYHSYGMTETLSHVALRQINPPAEKSYLALPDVSFSTDDRDCLIVKAPKVCDTDVVTNDVVKLHNNKEFEWLGRYDNIINCGGIKLNPESIENKLKAFITSPFIVSSLPDEKLGNRLLLIVEGQEAPDLSLLNKQLDKYEQIREIRTVSQFHYTASGKIKRREI